MLASAANSIPGYLWEKTANVGTLCSFPGNEIPPPMLGSVVGKDNEENR